MSGRELTDEELQKVITHVAQAGFDPNARERARGALAGMEWGGETITSRTMLPPDIRHYLRHVKLTEEWPEGTTLEQYIASIREVITDEESGVLVGRYQGTPQITFLRRSKELEGLKGQDWVVVDYRVETGHWMTAYQIRSRLEVLNDSSREDVRWLREPKNIE